MASPVERSPRLGAAATWRRPSDNVVGLETRKVAIAVRVGIPSEVKNHEYRVAITPAGVHELSRHGHDVAVAARRRAAARRSPTTSSRRLALASSTAADDVWAEADLVLKVKEPIAEEYHRMRPGQVLFTYLHLAASRECTQALLDSGITAIAYETVQLPDRSLPLLAPMSEVAGRMAPRSAPTSWSGHGVAAAS